MKHFLKIIFITMVMIVVSGFPAMSFAAYLYASPSQSTIETGKNITVNILLASASKSTNAVSGTLVYPTDKLSLVSTSSSASIVQQWLPPGATGPKVNAGSVRFEGVMISGFQGPQGKIFSATFKTLAEGDATIGFTTDQILANDGNATNITDPSKTAVVHITKAAPATETPAQQPEPSEEVVIPIEIPVETPVPEVSDQTLLALQVKNLSNMVMYMMILQGAFLIIIVLLIVVILNLIHQNISPKVKPRKKTVTKTTEVMVD